MFVAWLILACGTPETPVETVPTPTDVAPVPTAIAPAADGSPKLVVFIVVDQFPVRLYEALLPVYTGGFAKLSSKDAYISTARHHHAITFTCPGHATLSTGVSPSVHGIVSNDWRVNDEPIYCAKTEYLRAPALADQVVDAGGTVASVSLKDRGAIMMGGHKPSFVAWWDKKALQFVGTPDAPWLATAFDAQVIENAEWGALLPDFYAKSWADKQDWEHGPAGLGTTFPHPSPRAAGMEAFLATPMSGTALTDVAIATVDKLKLGVDDKPDLLAVSYSEVDYIGHGYTSESWEAFDGVLRLDADLGRLFAHLDSQIGAGNWSVVLSSDHGSAPHTDKRFSNLDVAATADEALVKAGFTGKVALEEPSLWLPAELRADPVKRKAAADAVGAAIRAMPLIDAYAWRDGDFPADERVAEALRLSFDDERSGDLFMLDEMGAIPNYPDSIYQGTTHGTPWDYDQLVPFLAYGNGIAPGRASGENDTRQIAATAAALLKVAAPPLAGPPVTEALRVH